MPVPHFVQDTDELDRFTRDIILFRRSTHKLQKLLLLLCVVLYDAFPIVLLTQLAHHVGERRPIRVGSLQQFAQRASDCFFRRVSA